MIGSIGTMGFVPFGPLTGISHVDRHGDHYRRRGYWNGAPSAGTIILPMRPRREAHVVNAGLLEGLVVVVREAVNAGSEMHRLARAKIH